MKIYDICMFFNELDVLEIHLNELYDHVDYFVIVECTYTFTGVPKKINFLDNINRYSKYMDKIIYFVLDYIPDAYGINESSRNWEREKFNREFLRFELIKLGLNDEDIILSVDLDEIVDSEIVKKIRNRELLIQNNTYYCLEMDLYVYNIETKNNVEKWYHSKLLNYYTLKNCQLSLHQIRSDLPINHLVIIYKAGWHLSYFGDTSTIFYKLSSFAHAADNRIVNVLDKKIIEEKIKTNIFVGNDTKLTHIPIKENTWLPKYYFLK